MDISSRSLKSPGVIIAVLSAVSLGIVGFGLFLMLRPVASTTPAEEAGIEAPPVGDRQITALGRIEPAGGIYSVAAPSSINSSRVLKVQVQEGAQVQKGQLLAVMDSYEQLRAEAIQAESQVVEAQSNLEQVKAGAKLGDIEGEVEAARASESRVNAQQAAVLARAANLELVAAQLEQARTDWKRYTGLQNDGAISESALETRKLAYDTKQKELNQAQMLLEQAIRQRDEEVALAKQAVQRVNSVREVRPEDIQRAEAGIQSALANLARAKVELDQSAVVAPISGQVLEIHTTDGEAVGSQGILDLARTDRMTVVAEVYETDIRDVQVGQPATVTSPALANPLRGRVAQVGLKIDKKDVLDTDPAADTDARVVEVTVLLENSGPVASLTNLQVNVAIDTAAPVLLRPSPGSAKAPGASSSLGQPGGLSGGGSLNPGLLQNGLLDNPLPNEPGIGLGESGEGEPSSLDGGES